MSHTIRDKAKLMRRVRRIIGQMEAVSRSLAADEECAEIMQLITAARGAINSLMAEVAEDHIRQHMGDRRRRPTSAETRAAREVIDVVRRCVRR